MALFTFAYDELVICPQCGGYDFTFLKPIERLRCNACKTSYTERELVEEAIDTMSDYIKNNGITERLPDSAANPGEYRNTRTLAALIAALQILHYPEAVTPAALNRAIGMLRAAIEREYSLAKSG